MKKTIFIFFLSSISYSAANAQGYFEMGYRVGHLKCDNLNRSVYVYNYTRKWLDTKMDYFGNHGKGISVAYGQQFDLLGWEMGFTNFHEKHIANGLEPTTGLIAYRSISYFNYGLYLAFPVRIINKEHLEINFSPSFDASFNNIQLEYTHDATMKSIEEGVTATSEGKFGSTMALVVKLFPVRWFGIDLKPFASFNFHKLDVSGVQGELQGAAAAELPDSFFSYGLNLNIVFAHRDY